MQQDLKLKLSLPESRQKRSLKRLERKSYSVELLNKKLESLISKAVEDDHQSLLRLEAIRKLLDPCLDFYESDVSRIINKGYPIQVERGLVLYRMMSRLRILLEPVGTRKGVSCSVRLIDFERLSYSSLLDVRGLSFYLMQKAGSRFPHGGKFNGLDLLTSEERSLYLKVKPYFGGRKRPTLKSLAIGLLGEIDEVYSERNATNYLAAVKDFQLRHRKQLGISWYFIWTVDSFGSDRETGRELSARLNQLLYKAFRAQAQEVAAELARVRERFAHTAVTRELIKVQLAEAARVRDQVAQAVKLSGWIEEERARFREQVELLAKAREQAAQIAGLHVQRSKLAAERELIAVGNRLAKVIDSRPQFARVAAALMSSLPKVELPPLDQRLREAYAALKKCTQT